MHNYYSTKNQTIIHFLCYKITKNYDFGYAGFKEFRQHISSLTQSNRYLSHIILMRLPCDIYFVVWIIIVNFVVGRGYLSCLYPFLSFH